MRADWIITPPAPPAFTAALRDVHPLTAQVLHARGFNDPAAARAFLAGDVPPVDPFALRDMPAAVERILLAIQHAEQIMLFGDYDCDGVTSCALLTHTLRGLGATVDVYIPDRFEEGYGLNTAALDRLKAQGTGLVVTVDCGARAVREAAHARAIGLDLIITDHHELEPDAIPQAIAMVDPMRPDCPYPFKQLAGVGVAFRLAQCLLRRAREQGLPRAVTEASLLDLVAIGTIADVVALVGENRPLVRAGLRQINTAPRPGVLALVQAASLRAGEVNAGRVGFALGPRLNAAGRLESARAAYELLVCEDRAAAISHAARLDQQNSERQAVTARVARDAEQQALAERGAALLFAASDEYSPGVIGLAAARLVEKHYRPAVVVSTGGGEARGSCRSVPGFHMTKALDECRDLLIKHGGHAAAAGFSMDAARVHELRARLNALIERDQPADGWLREVRADGDVPMGDLSPQIFGELEHMEPHGMGNPKPAFVVRGARVLRVDRMGKAEPGQAPPHLRLRLGDGRRAPWDAVAWRMGERASELRQGAEIDAVVQFDVNEWNGERRLQLEVKDFRPSRA
jgi:single-stranded-DNA-specific exonuclease